jgi:four helix bundle protein
MPFQHLNVADAAERVEDAINALIDRSKRRLLHANQLRRSAHAIVANLAEGFGRGRAGDKARSIEIARGEAEEAIRHLNANYRSRRIDSSQYWPIRNQLVVIVKMLDGLPRGADGGG